MFIENIVFTNKNYIIGKVVEAAVVVEVGVELLFCHYAVNASENKILEISCKYFLNSITPDK